jgi:predicted phosphoribosyltransferase
MGQIIAETLGGELDVVLVHKLGAPGNPELAIGAVDETVGVYLSEFPIRSMADGGLKQRADLSRRTSVYQSAIRHPSNQA